MGSEILDDFTQELVWAGYGKRFFAFLIDIIGIIILIYVIGIYCFDLDVPVILKRKIKVAESLDFERDRWIIKYLSFFIWVIYSMIMEFSRFQGTLGKVLMKIKVVDKRGKRLDFSRSVIRNSMKLLSYIVYFLGFIWIFLDKKQRGWHDLFAQTRVIKK